MCMCMHVHSMCMCMHVYSMCMCMHVYSMCMHVYSMCMHVYSMCMLASGARRTACTGLTSCGGSRASHLAAGRRQSNRASPGSMACY